MSHLKQILEYPEIRRAFDLAVAKHPATRKWMGYLLKKVMRSKTKLSKADRQAIYWTLIKLSKKGPFAMEDYLFAAGNAIYIEEHKKYSWLEVKRETKDRMSHVGESLKNWR